MSEKQKCLMCLNEKSLNRFYKSKSNLHSNKVVPYCKDCLNSLNLFDINTLIDTLQKIDVPYVKKFWDNVVEQNIENPSGLLGKYIKIIAIQFPDKTFKDSDIFEENINKLIKLDEKINNKEKKLNKLENEIEENKKIKEKNNKELELEKEFDIESLQEKWGLDFTSSDYIAFEKKFQYLKDAIPNQTKLHIETLITYIRYQVKAEQAIAKGEADDAKKWGNNSLHIK